MSFQSYRSIVPDQWLPPTPDRSSEAKAFVPPDSETRRLATHVPQIFAPRVGKASRLSRFVAWMMVAPFAQVTVLNLEYQAYLLGIFHRTRGAKLSHAIAVPFNVLFALCAFSALFPYGGWVLFGFFSIWYLLMAWTRRDWLYAVALVFSLSVLFTISHLLLPHLSLGWSVLGIAVSSGVAAFGHGYEPDVPPRTNGSRWWISIPVFLNLKATKGWKSRLHHVGRIGVSVVFGFSSEWWAAPRVLGVGILQAMYWLGHDKARSERLNDYVARAVASGQPAVDFIGVGGGTWLSELPE